MWLLLISATAFLQSSAQSFDEWFHQKETQIKYIKEQLTALKVYYDYASKGYELVADGLHAVQQIKEGDLQLHTAFFERLKNVNPIITNAPTVADIEKMHSAIAQITSLARSYVQGEPLLQPDEIQYLNNVLDRVSAAIKEQKAGLLLVIQDGSLELHDDERINRMESIADDVRSLYAFTRSFVEEIRLLVEQRKAALLEVQRSKILSSKN